MAAVPAEVHGPSDAELITSVRGGQLDAYGALYERHVGAAYNLARQLSRSSAESDDLVSEAFAKVLDTLRAGRGPDSSFRAYLLTALRHVAYDKTRRDRRVELTEDVTTATGVSTEKISEPFRDTAVAGLERSLAAKAFARLPERWQAVLWHTEIEGQSPAEVAPLLGLTANGVSALAYRAREGLRQAYLQVHLAETALDASQCRATVDKLGAWTRDGLSKREKAQVEAHLDTCDQCRALAAELREVNSALVLYIAPLVLGAGAAGYLALTAGKTAGVTAVAAVSAGGAAGAAGSSSGGAAGAASSLPRQFLGVGASVAALAAALAIALSSSPGNSVPSAAAPAPTHTPTSAPAVPGKPAPAAPQNPTTQPPKPAPNTTPPTTTQPTTTTPAPAPTVLHASGPSQSITLVPGDGPVDLPITVQNTGGTASQPVTASLNLPPGVSAVGPTTATTAHPSAALHQTPSDTNSTPAAPALANAANAEAYHPATTSAAGPQSDSTTPTSTSITANPTATDATATNAADVAAADTAAGDQVACPGGTGTVSCTSSTGLQPGQSVVLMFRVEAASGTSGGTITGTVSAGGSISVNVAVHVDVPPPPVAEDGVSVTAHQVVHNAPWWQWQWDLYPLLDITVTNTGSTTKPVTVDLDRAGVLTDSDPLATCLGIDHSTDCQSVGSLAPHQSLHLDIRLYGLPQGEGHDNHDVVDVTATLGTATNSTSAPVTGSTWPWPPTWFWPFPTPPTTSTTAPAIPTPTTTPSTTTTSPTTPTTPQIPTTTPTTPPLTTTTTPTPATTTPTTTQPTTPQPTTTPTTPTWPTCTTTGSFPGGHVQPGEITTCGPLNWLLND